MLERLAAARIDIRDPRAIEPEAVAIVHEWPGRRSVARGERVTILAHYDPAGVGPAFLDQVDAFVTAGREVVVCSTSLDDGDVSDPLLERVLAVLRIPNTGYDWGSYQAGLRYVLDRFEPASVLLANDSVYVLSDRLGPFLDRLEALPVDVAAATDSAQLAPHLQSYLLHLPSRVLEGPLGDELLTTFVPIASKELVIHAYELGVSRRAVEHGLGRGSRPSRRGADGDRRRDLRGDPERSPADRGGDAGRADAASLAAAARRRLPLREAAADS